MAWSTRWLQQCLDEALTRSGVVSVEHVTQMAPIHHQHINFNGQFQFDVAAQDSRLFEHAGTLGS